MKRGDIYWVNFEPSSPPEFGKIRPALIISNSEQNTLLPTVVVLPLSSKPPEIWPLRVKVSFGGSRRSFAVIPGIRQVNKARLVRPIGPSREKDLKSVSEAVSLYLGE